MKILLVSAYFPPWAPTAATRIGKLSKYFLDRGHDVRVLTAGNPRFPPILPLEIPEDLVSYVPFTDVNTWPGRIADMLRGGTGRETAEGEGGNKRRDAESAPAAAPARPSWRSRLTALFQTVTNIPDAYVGWYRPAVRAGREIIRSFQPDVIYTSLPMHTGLLVAARLGRLSGVPVVAEYRDLWVEHPYYAEPFWRRWIETWLERRAARSVAGYVTVTRGWAEWLEDSRRKPTELVFNGFDPADFDPALGPSGSEPRLTLIYAGALYGQKRDPAPLFEAMRMLGDEARKIRVLFHTSDMNDLAAKIAAYGVEQSVEVKGPIPHGEVLKLEQESDILLLLRWNHPSEEAVVAGKLFEYIGAGRPILSVGLETGEAAEIIRRNGFGVVSNDPQLIAGQLRDWLRQKEQGPIPSPNPKTRPEFARDKQFAKLETFLTQVCRGSASSQD